MIVSGAALALAAAVTAAGPAGAARLRAVMAPPVAPPDDVPVRPLWVAVGGATAAALAWAATGSVPAALVLGAAVCGFGVLVRRRWRRRGRRDDDPTDLAAAWTQLAVCLEVGLPVGAAVAAAAAPLDGRSGEDLHRVAALLELGADPAQAWCAAEANPTLAAFARAAGRSAGTGAALARVAHAEAARRKAAVADAAEERAQRAAVLITAPLGLCFLPAFLVLGIAPVVIGLADHALGRW